jgi:hypothetical protein
MSVCTWGRFDTKWFALVAWRPLQEQLRWLALSWIVQMCERICSRCVCRHACFCVFVCAYCKLMCVCVYACLLVFACSCWHGNSSCAPSQLNIHKQSVYQYCIYAHVYVYVCMYMYACMYVCTHTHTHMEFRHKHSKKHAHARSRWCMNSRFAHTMGRPRCRAVSSCASACMHAMYVCVFAEYMYASVCCIPTCMYALRVRVCIP